MKTITLLIALFLIAGVGLKGQTPFYPQKEGMKLTYAEKNAKGKITGYTQTTIRQVDVADGLNFSVACESQVMDDKKKPLLTKPIEIKVEVVDGVVIFDPASLAGKLTEGMQVTGGNLLLPANVSLGDALEDYAVEVAIGPIKTSSAFSGIKVAAEQTLQVDGKTLSCLLVESDVLTKALGMKQEMKQKVWYARGIGQVKTETYNKKGKLQTVQELVSITN
jgi:hypothetical protein